MQTEYKARLSDTQLNAMWQVIRLVRGTGSQQIERVFNGRRPNVDQTAQQALDRSSQEAPL